MTTQARLAQLGRLPDNNGTYNLQRSGDLYTWTTAADSFLTGGQDITLFTGAGPTVISSTARVKRSGRQIYEEKYTRALNQTFTFGGNSVTVFPTAPVFNSGETAATTQSPTQASLDAVAMDTSLDSLLTRRVLGASSTSDIAGVVIQFFDISSTRSAMCFIWSTARLPKFNAFISAVNATDGLSLDDMQLSASGGLNFVQGLTSGALTSAYLIYDATTAGKAAAANALGANLSTLTIDENDATTLLNVDAIVNFVDTLADCVADQRNSELTTDIRIEADIDALQLQVATNVTNIATNVTGIAGNVTNISTNAAGIATNVTNIATNATGIATNVTNIATNAAGIATNVTNIATNATGIATNVTAITTNASGIATNVTAIATNATAIAANATAIATNTSGLADEITRAELEEMRLAGLISAEASARIAGDTTLQTAINNEASTARAAELANTNAITAEASTARAAEGANATNITANAGNIATNVTDIATNATAIATETTNRESADTALQANIDLKQNILTQAANAGAGITIDSSQRISTNVAAAGLTWIDFAASGFVSAATSTRESVPGRTITLSPPFGTNTQVFRFIPDTYNAQQDAIYSDSALTSLLVTRARL